MQHIHRMVSPHQVRPNRHTAQAYSKKHPKWRRRMTADLNGRAAPARKRALKDVTSRRAAATLRPGINVKDRLTGMQTMPLDRIKPNP
jgi:hypothetical protein